MSVLSDRILLLFKITQLVGGGDEIDLRSKRRNRDNFLTVTGFRLVTDGHLA
ncbi:hypothetical protein ACPOL_6059 [Acidisarcina polymorpha]|uniref:Uncharacterized protein n=1 Tax=Acidisarcina polymorpha TaxID=2211140 RepID=A0A2Z5G7R1_9BACT|nr:hypothetical protein [Acidisarcina polymorpha]AXC15303.1 hypothetical protein ACPOL_6059 [Acidisarcina polymorpha]